MEIHLHRFDSETRTWHLSAHPERDSLVGLDADHQDILVESLAGAVEEDAGYGFEGDRDLGATLGHPLRRADEERNVGPAPVIDVYLERDISLGDRSLGHTIRLTVTRYGLAIDKALLVLGAHDVIEDIVTTQGTQGAQDLHFLIADRISAETRRRLHRGEGEELEEMVLNHVTHRPRGVVVTGASLHAEWLGGSDLNMGDMVVIPDRFEDRVGEAHHHDVLGRLLAEIMIDTVGVALGEDLADKPVEKLGRLEILSERLLDNDSRPTAGSGGVQSALTEVIQDDGELIGRHGKVVKAIAPGAAFAVGLLHLGGEGAVSLGIVKGTLVVMDRGGKARPEFLVEGCPGKLSRRLLKFLAELLAGLLASCKADDRDRGRESPFGGKVIERRDQLAVRQISGCAENDEGAGLGSKAAGDSLAERICGWR